jgi:predicted Zn-dependent protease
MAKLRRTSTPFKSSKSKNTKAKAAAKPKPARKSVPLKKTPVKAKPAPRPAPKATRKPAAKPAPKVTRKPVPKLALRNKPITKATSKTPAAMKPKAVQPVLHRSTYVDAVALYERGVQALQAHHYKEANDLLSAVVAKFPEEKELHERALLYIQICQRQIDAPPRMVETADDKVFSATLALNNGALDQATLLLSSVVREDPDHDHATYMLGVTYALRGNNDLAVQLLARSMGLNPENHELARKDPDLEALRSTDEFRAVLASPPALIQRKEKKAKKAR